jgi:hypothetical protein
MVRTAAMIFCSGWHNWLVYRGRGDDVPLPYSHAMPRGYRPAVSRTSTISTQPALPHKRMLIDSTRTIHPQILSELCAYYNVTTVASSA